MGPRVLVVGGHIAENQFVRQVRSAGCDVIWHDGRAGKSFPHFCDALVCAKYQLSHEGFWAAKAAYKGKPMFVADHSWSTIKEKFELFVDDWELKNKNKQTTLGAAMQKAIQHTNGSAAGTPMTTWKGDPIMSTKKKARYSDEARNAINAVIIAAEARGQGVALMTAQLNGKGITRADGKPFKLQDVHNFMRKLRPGGAVPAKTTEAPSPVIPKIEATRSTDKLVYELILSANLPAVETTALMRKCMDGKLTQNECLKFIELYTDLKGGA